MTRRPAVTLIEVLVAMFIMAIGMLALLVLFPLGALNMGQALKDDRCASAAFMAEQIAILPLSNGRSVRHDPSILTYPNPFAPTPPPTVNLFLTQWPISNPPTQLPASYTLQSFPVFVDPYFASSLSTLGTAAPFIARVTPNYAGSLPLVDRWFSLPNDITFLNNGTPDLTNINVERGRRYTWAYMLRRPQAFTDDAVDLTVVVYSNRPTAAPIAETTYAAAGAATTGGLVLSWPVGQPSPNLKRGIWVLDTTPIVGTGVAGIPAIPQANFYRIVNITDVGGNQAAVDVQPNLTNDVSQVVIMDHVAEVFAKGSSWQP